MMEEGGFRMATDQYDFTAGGETFDLTLTVTTGPNQAEGLGTVTAISGTADGQVILGLSGFEGSDQQVVSLNPYAPFNFDGLSFYTVDDTFNVYSVGNDVVIDQDEYLANAPVEDASLDVTCYLHGTHIMTPSGEVRIEALGIGDLVMTAAGVARPVRWLGRQTVSTKFADPLRALPIRIRAGAIADGLPRRDLLVSASHAVLVDDILIQAGALVNGVSIIRETQVPEVLSYYHVEIAAHALILAEHLPAETFVDHVSRETFDNWAEYQALGIDSDTIPEMAYPRAKSHRQVPYTVRARLAARAAALGGTMAAA